MGHELRPLREADPAAGLAHIGAGGLPSDGPRCLLWLGSSIGNFDRRGAADFLKDAAQSALRPGDTMLISIDRRNKPEEVAAAYNDANGKTREFILEGLRHADKVLGGGVLDVGKFEYHDRYNAIEVRAPGALKRCRCAHDLPGPT